MPLTGERISAAPAKRSTPGNPIRRHAFSTTVTVVTDLAMAAISVLLGFVWAINAVGDEAARTPLIYLFIPTVIALLAVRNAYQHRLDQKILNVIGPVETTVAVAIIVVLTGIGFYGVDGRVSAVMTRVWICAAILMPLGRLLIALAKRRLRRTLYMVGPTLIVGNGRVAHQIIERLEGSPEYGLKPIGLLDIEAPQSGNDAVPGSLLPYIGSPDSIEQAVLDTGAENIVIAFSRDRDEVLTRVVHIAHQHGLRVWVVPRMFDVIGERARIEHIGGLPLLALSYTNPYSWQFTAKHVSDRVLAGLGLLVISPLFLTLMLLVRVTSPGPIFFQQERVGRDGKPFGCLKFRSMRMPSDADAAFALRTGAAPGGVEGEDRRTKIGKLMRATSLDELPQFLNVLKGDMSLVGPRPERPEFVELFEIQIRRYGDRHRVKAGVTGWAQVHGLRGQTSIADRAEWDNYYIENWSLGLDLKILALTVLAVLRGSE
jgi:exopolysaccharide biosynthesis polyprenyl glycosylphosphotransferase